MISRAGVGIAVENATREAKSVADYITVSNEEHAIANIIYDIAGGKISIS
jgi:hydroxymethylpyrimidine pyrophosphatase-like HAD family hydrolase